MVALATSQRMASSNPSLNFIGAELAITAEQIGIEGFKCTHIPGVANGIADYLSRPDRVAKEKAPEELEGARSFTTSLRLNWPRSCGSLAPLPTIFGLICAKRDSFRRKNCECVFLISRGQGIICLFDCTFNQFCILTRLGSICVLWPFIRNRGP